MPLIPHGPVVARPPPEDDLFLDRDGDPDREPIAHDREEIGEDLTEMVPSREGADEVDDHTNGGPDKPWDTRGCAAEDLEIDASYVGWEDAVGDDTKGDDDGQETPEAIEAVFKGGDYQGALAGGVGGGVGGCGGDTGGEADAGEEAEGEGAGEA